MLKVGTIDNMKTKSPQIGAVIPDMAKFKAVFEKNNRFKNFNIHDAVEQAKADMKKLGIKIPKTHYEN